MIKCPVCSTVNMDIVSICENCGSDLSETEHPKYIYARQHPSYWQLTIIAILFPDTGVILGFIYRSKNAYLDKKLGGHLLLMGILFFFIRLLITLIFMKATNMI